MSLRSALLVALPALLFAACAQEEGLTYHVRYDATPDERLAIAEAFDAWARSTGVGAREVAQPGKAVILVQFGTQPTYLLGHAHYDYDRVFDPSTLQYRDVLSHATITTSPELREADHDAQVRYYNHEIGHIMTRGGHTEGCPSTMNAFPQDCGTQDVDEPAASLARTNLRDGWLQHATRILP